MGPSDRPAAAEPDDPRLKRLDSFADLLDSRFRVPGTELRFGLDSLVGLIPGVGDTATALSSFYIVYQSRQLGARRWTLVRMAGNVLLDGVLGAVPLLGDVFDFAWKANRRNLDLLRADLQSQAARRAAPFG